MLARLWASLSTPRCRAWAAAAERAFCAGLLVLCVLALAYELIGCFSAFTWQKFGRDHGVYTNMVWNTAHGSPFLFELNHSYLMTHLSFSVALFAPLFHLWDHPFLLSVVQWALLAGGACLVWRSARRGGVHPVLAAALTLFLAAYPLAQTVVLVEFHGAGLYLLTIPWLYVCLSERPRSAWLPLLLHVGAREDAFIAALPMLLYFGFRTRRPAVWSQFAFALLYAVVSIGLLYPLINGVSLFSVRHGWMPTADTAKATFATVGLWSIFWCVLPMVPFAGRGWLAPLIFISAPLIQALVSRSPNQRALAMQYAAPVITTLAVGLLESARLAARRGAARPLPRALPVLQATLLLLAIAGANHMRGFLPGGSQRTVVYARPQGRGLDALDAAAHVPKNGILLCAEREEAFCGNRALIKRWDADALREPLPDWLLLPFKNLTGSRDDELGRMLNDGAYGIVYLNDSYGVLQRGTPSLFDAEVQRRVARSARTVVFMGTPLQLGSNTFGNDGGVLRYWRGKGSAATGMLAFGKAIRLPAGDYQARFSLGAQRPKHTVRGHWGLLQLAPFGTNTVPFVEQRVAEHSRWRYDLTEQLVPFSLTAETDVEPRVIAGDARLWLAKVVLEDAAR